MELASTATYRNFTYTAAPRLGICVLGRKDSPRVATIAEHPALQELVRVELGHDKRPVQTLGDDFEMVEPILDICMGYSSTTFLIEEAHLDLVVFVVRMSHILVQMEGAPSGCVSLGVPRSRTATPEPLIPPRPKSSG